MQAELEVRHDAEIAAAAADGPEQVGVLVGGSAYSLAAGSDDVRRDEIVDGQSVLARQPAETAAEGQARNARRRVDPNGEGEAVGSRLGIDVGEDELVDLFALKKFNFGGLVAVRDSEDRTVKVFKRDKLRSGESSGAT